MIQYLVHEEANLVAEVNLVNTFATHDSPLSKDNNNICDI